MICVRHHNLRDGAFGFSAILLVGVVVISVTFGFFVGGYFERTGGNGGVGSEWQQHFFGFFSRVTHVFSATVSDVFGGGDTPLAQIDVRDDAGDDAAAYHVSDVREDELVSVTELQKSVAVQKTNVWRDAQHDDRPTVAFVAAHTKQTKGYEPCRVQDSTTKDVQGVVINEIAWMGSVPQAGESATAAAAAEWIELANTTEEDVDVSGWQLRLDTGKIHSIFPSGTRIVAHGFLLLERGSDDVVLGVVGDIVYGGLLANGGGRLQLLDDRCHLMDEANFTDGWPAGNTKTKQTMQRAGDQWETSMSPGGTPGKLNPTGITKHIIQKTQTASSSVSVATSTAATSTVIISDGGGSGSSSGGSGGGFVAPVVKTYPKLLIAQIQLAGATSTHQEFVEFYNPTDASVDLTGWYVQKKTKSGTSFSSFAPKELFVGHGIPAHGFFVVAHPSSSLVADAFTDNGMSDDNAIVLKNPNGDASDRVGMGEANECEGVCAANPEDGESIRRKTGGGATDFVDTDNNEADFESSTCPTPKATSICTTPIIVTSTSTDPVASSTATSTPPVQPAPTSTATSTDPNPPGNSSSTATSTPPIASSTVPVVVITKVQITGMATDLHPTQKDAITFCNTGTSDADISGWSLRKKTKTATASDSIKSFSSGTVLLVGQCAIWANSADDFAATLGAQFSTTATIAGDASIALVDGSGAVIDAVAWGSGHASPFAEGSAFAQNPDQPGQYLQRKLVGGAYQDTQDNATDFELLPPSPT